MPFPLNELPFDIDSNLFAEYIGLLSEHTRKDIYHSGYYAHVNHALELAVHAVKDSEMENPKARELIELNRPNEPEAVRLHRIANYRQITYPQWERMQNTLYKIFNPRLTAVKYQPMPPNITSTLELYDEEIGTTKFIEGQVFTSILRDPNAVVATIPRAETIGDTSKFPEPVPMLFESHRVIDYMRGKYYLLQSRMDSDMGEKGMTGDVFYLIDKKAIYLIIEAPGEGNKSTWDVDLYYTHDLGITPVVHLPGMVEVREDYSITLSFLSGVLPNWNEALVVKSDYQAVRTRNAHPKFWQIKIKCPKCKGAGSQTSGGMGGKQRSCGECEGTGMMGAQGPGDVLVLDSKGVADGKIPTPPADYIEPNPELLKYLREDYALEIEAGFAAVNMDHLRKMENVQESGLARAQGRIDLNTFMDKVASGTYQAWDEINFFVADLRYKAQISDVSEIVPLIERPKTYDLETASDLSEKIKTAKEAGLSADMVGKMKMDYVRKEFGEDSELHRRLQCKLDLDPLPGISPDDLVQLEMDTRKKDRWLHVNLDRMIDRAIDENLGFLEMGRPQKIAILYGYVDEELAAQTPQLIPSPE